MIREEYEEQSLTALRQMAKEKGMKGISALRKSELIDALVSQQEEALTVKESAAIPAAIKDGQEPETSNDSEQRPEPEIRNDSEQRPEPETRNGREQRPEPETRSGREQRLEPETRSGREQRPVPEMRSEREQRLEPEMRRQGMAAGRRLPPDGGGRRFASASGGRPGQESTGQVYRAGSLYRTQSTGTSYGERPSPDRSFNSDRNAGSSGLGQDRGYSYAADRTVADRASDRGQLLGRGENSVQEESVQPAYGQNRAGLADRDTQFRLNSAERTSSTYDVPVETVQQLDSGEKANGILEVLPEGYGFIRCENFLPGENDIYVSPSQIRRFGLRTGDIIQGNIRIKTSGEKFSALLYVTSINGYHPSEGQKRYKFEDMTPIFPNERIVLERPGGTTAMRVVDLISPIGKGQRGMIVSPPKAGKTTLLKDVAKSILQRTKEMHLIILLIDERPEEVTDIKEAIQGPNVEVIYSTFDETPEHHRRVSEMVIERARRLVEHRKDVTILLDSITRLARAYNLVIPPSGRTLSGGLDPAALHMPKRFFGAARNMREGGSLTILATALVDTGSKMDDVIYEEFKGTGNMELILDRKLQVRRIFPAIDIQKSGTRREDLLLTKEEQEAVFIMRRALNGMKSEDAAEQILTMFARTRTNAEFVQAVKRQKWQ